MVRAADSLSISNKKDMEGSIKKLGDKVAEVEKEKAEMKGEWAQEKRNMEQKMGDLETEKNMAIRNEKLMQERVKYQSEQQIQTQSSIESQVKKKLEEKDSQVKEMEGRVKGMELLIKQKEDEAFRRGTEFEKLNALVEQKLTLTENELGEYKGKYNLKDQDYKEVNKELYSSRKEV